MNKLWEAANAIFNFSLIFLGLVLLLAVSYRLFIWIVDF